MGTPVAAHVGAPVAAHAGAPVAAHVGVPVAAHTCIFLFCRMRCWRSFQSCTKIWPLGQRRSSARIVTSVSGKHTLDVGKPYSNCAKWLHI